MIKKVSKEKENNFIEETEKFIKKILKNEGWDTLYKLSIEWDINKHLILSKIDPYNWRINIQIDRNSKNIIENISNLTKMKIQQPYLKALYFNLKKVKGQWDYCPGDIYYLESILDGITVGLKKANLNDKHIKKYYLYVASLFIELICNSSIALKTLDTYFLEGMEVWYTTQVYLLQKANNYDYYSIFINSLFRLCQLPKVAEKISSRLSKNYKNLYNESINLVKSLLKGDEDVEKDTIFTIWEGKAAKKDLDYISLALMKKELWREKATKFAEIIGKYQKKNLNDIPELVILASPLEKMKNDENFRRAIIREGLNKGSAMLYADRFEILDEIYKKEAEKIIIELTNKKYTYTFNYPIFYMRKKRIEDSRDIENIEWGRTIIVENKNEPNLWLFKSETPYLHHYELSHELTTKTKNLQDLLFIIDASRSMSWTGVPLDESKYDISVRVLYSCINYLEKNKIAPYLKYGLIMFGDKKKTFWSGWKKYEELNLLKKSLFEKYGSTTTILLADKVKKAVSSNPRNFLTIMITDGEIYNKKEAKAACMSIIKRNNDFILFQIRSNSSFAREMEENGATVIYINNPKDLVKIAIKKVETKYPNKKVLGGKDGIYYF